MKNFLTFFSALFFCFFSIKTFSQDIGEQLITSQIEINLTDPIPVDRAVRHGVLPNGLTYFIRRNSKPVHRAELRLAVNSGSIQEDDDQLGVAHFVEHMCFNGSAHFKKNELVDYLESVGTKFGADLNAYTSFDETVYMLQSRTEDLEILKKGLLVLEDWAGAVLFDPEEIDKERGVVESEWRTRLSPEQRMQKIYFPIMYHNSRYAERLPIGKPEIIETVDYETVKRFYHDWYRPDLMAVAIVGDFDLDWMEKEVKSRFSKLTNPPHERKREIFKVPKHKETLISVVSDKEASFTNVRLMYKHDHIPVKKLADYRGQLVRSLYNRMLNARLGELGQSADPPFTFAYSGYGRDIGLLDTYEGYAMVAEGGALRGLKVLLEENKRVLRHGFLETELERQKTEMLRFAERSFKEKDKTESRRFVTAYVYHFLEDNPIPSAEQKLELYKQFLPTITLDDVNALAQKWITKENRVIVVTGPEKDETPLPSQDEILATLKVVDSKDMQPYEDKVSDDPLLATIPSPGEIADEKKFETVGVTQLTLSNGVRVILKPTDFKNDEILLTAYSPGGHSLYSDEDYPSASNAARIIDESGLGSFDVTQLGKKLTGKTVGVSPYISELYEGFNGSASPDDLETLFQLVHLYFTAPRKDEKAFQSFIAKQRSIYANLMSNPNFWFTDQSLKIKYNNHPRRGFPGEQSLSKISLEKVYEIYKDRFADASDFTFILVGNFEINPMKEYLKTYLATLPSLHRKESWKDVKAELVKGKVEKTFARGKAPKSLINMTFHGYFEWNSQNRYNLNALVQVLRIKMRESMREDKGGVYGVRVQGNARQFPKPSYSLTISFNSDPGNVDDLVKTAFEEIAHAKEVGAEEKDLVKVEEMQRQERIKNLKENRFWNRQLRNYYQHGNDPNKITLENLEQYIESLNAEDIKKAANQYLDEQNFIKLVLNPAAKKENQ